PDAHHVHVGGVALGAVAAPAGELGADQRTPAAKEGIQHDLAWPGAVEECPAGQLHGLLGRVEAALAGHLPPRGLPALLLALGWLGGIDPHRPHLAALGRPWRQPEVLASWPDQEDARAQGHGGAVVLAEPDPPH